VYAVSQKPGPQRTRVKLHNGDAFTLHEYSHAEPQYNVSGKLLGWRLMFRCGETGRMRQYGYETPLGVIQTPGRAA
jgi:hypothetical protein